MKNFDNKNTSLQSGFTLIELLVVVIIMIISLGLGIAGFIQFSERQTAVSVAKEVQAYMNAAQAKARLGEGADTCPSSNSLRGYNVSVSKGTVTLSKSCAPSKFSPENQRTYEVIDTVYPSEDADIRMLDGSDINMEFLSLHSGVDGYGTIRVFVGDYVYEFEVSSGGDISEGGFVTPTIGGDNDGGNNTGGGGDGDI